MAQIGTPIKGWRVDKNGKLVKIDKRNLIQKLQSGSKKKFKPVGSCENVINATGSNVRRRVLDNKRTDDARGGVKDGRGISLAST